MSREAFDPNEPQKLAIVAFAAAAVVFIIALIVLTVLNLWIVDAGDRRLLWISVCALGAVFACLLLLFVRWIVLSLHWLTRAVSTLPPDVEDVDLCRSRVQEIRTLADAIERLYVKMVQRCKEADHRAAAAERRTRLLEQAAGAMRGRAEVGLGATLEQLCLAIADLSGWRVRVYMADTATEWLVLQAMAGGDMGARLHVGYRVRIGSRSAVGLAALEGTPNVVRTSGEEAVYLDLAEWSDFGTLVALPLLSDGRVLGVLEVCSAEAIAVTDRDLSTLDVIANQVASLIEQERMLEELYQDLAAARQAYGESTRRAWVEQLKDRSKRGYICSANGVVSLSEKSYDDRPDLATLRIPIAVRGQVIGSVRARKARVEGRWTAQERALLETLVGQLAVALDGARLYEEVQQRAASDRLVSDLATSVGQSLDVEMVLRTAVQELRDSLQLASVAVHLQSPNTSLDGEARNGNSR